ncbi:MAG TPA: response regulator [Acidimicrobiales bacterium]|nr:response regulator [Acidimicrobiales bacterium]
MSAAERTPERHEVVLVVDDNDPVREGLCRMLDSAGIRSVAANSFQDAVRLQAAHLPAVAVIDDRLPDGSGTELAHAIRERNPETLVIMLTGFASLDAPADAGGRFYAHLIKPVRSVEFVTIVGDALAQGRADREVDPH